MKVLVSSVNAKLNQSRIACAIVCCIVLLLQGCGIPILRNPLPAPGLPQSFRLPPVTSGPSGFENSSLIDPTAFFEDPTLSALIDQALFFNQELRILAQDIAIANNEIMRRRGMYLPFFTLGGTAALDRLSTFTPPGADLSQIVSPLGKPFPNPLPNFLFATNISWEIDIWRQLRNARDAAGLRYLGSIDGRNFVVTRVVAEVAENYYKLMGLDNQLMTLDATIAIQEQSLKIAIAQKEGARGTELGVQRFLAEVRKNQSQKLVVRQEIIETENRINFLCGRYPQPVERVSAQFLDLQLQTLSVGVPSQLLQNRPDVREAERKLAAAGIDIRVARANFFPKLIITSGVGYESFNPRYLFFTPESLIYGVAGNLVGPLINKAAIRADYLNASAEQLQSLYDYQRKILIAFTEVVNRVSKVQNYSQSVALKKQQLMALDEAVDVANKLFSQARVPYLDVMTAQRDRNEQKIVLIETKQEQLAAIVNAYQALGGGWRYVGGPIQLPPDEGDQAPDQVPPGTPVEELPPPLPMPPLPAPDVKAKP